jgi:uncharacterized protein
LIQYGTRPDAKALIEQSPVDILDGEGRTPLLYAAFHGDSDLIRWLLERGATVNHQDRNGYSPLQCAAQNGHLEAVVLLINSGANPNLCDIHGNGPLWTASHQASLAKRRDEDLQVVNALVRAGADPNHKNRHGRSPLDIGMRNRELNSVLTGNSNTNEACE